ncbi:MULTISPECIES: hypothetical protein [unclassified Microbacterium]|uniref:hypothetical protein n=1 Tax=unclassified Microbacterium TaxID=2609290 RepID=UPI003017D4D5
MLPHNATQPAPIVHHVGRAPHAPEDIAEKVDVADAIASFTAAGLMPSGQLWEREAERSASSRVREARA